jgi:hypothetical protein
VQSNADGPPVDMATSTFGNFAVVPNGNGSPDYVDISRVQFPKQFDQGVVTGFVEEHPMIGSTYFH